MGRISVRGLGAVCLVAIMTGMASAQFTTDGFITSWLLLGEYQQPDGANPSVFDIGEDYLTDGASIDEWSVEPLAGDEVETDYNVSAFSLGLIPNALRGDADKDGFPEWFAWHDPDGHIDFSAIFGDFSNAMTYACVYIFNDTGGDLDVDIGCGSDDSIQVYVNDEPVWTNSVARGYGGGVQDRFPATLVEGANRILVKVFEGGGGHNFGLRIEEQFTMRPLMIEDGLIPSLHPAGGILGVRDVPDVTPLSPEETRISVSKFGDVSGQIVVLEKPPLGWIVSDISGGGALQPDGRIRWTLSAADLPEDVSYRIESPFEDAPGYYSGTVEGTVGGKPYSGGIGGETMTLSGGGAFPPPEISALGYIKAWLLLGQYVQSGGAAPGLASIAKDYLGDGVLREELIVPEAGDEIETDYTSCAGSASTGLAVSPNGMGDEDGNGFPEWFDHLDADQTIDYNEIFGDVSNVMTYACTYVTNPLSAPIDCYLGASSDDSISIYINTEPVWSNNIARGAAGAGADQDTAPVRLLPGKNRILVKCFEGGGGHGILFRLKDEAGNPIFLPVTVDPTGCVIPAFGVERKLPATARLRGPMEVALKGVGTGAGQVTIRDTVPAGWEILDAGGGTKDGQTIAWTRSADNIAIRYTVKGPSSKFGTARFRGTYTPAGGVDLGIFGRVTVGDGAPASTGSSVGSPRQTPFGQDGYIRNWLLLGPIIRPDGSCPPPVADISADYLANADSSVTQEDILPYEAMPIDIDFGGNSRGTGWHRNAKTGAPAWLAYYDNEGGINVNDELWTPDPDNVMCHGVFYVTNTTGSSLEVYLGIGSDDAIEVWLDDTIVQSVASCRGWGWPTPQNVLGPVVLEKGFQHRIMTKVYEAGGGWNFYLRFQDEAGVAITDGLDVTLVPEAGGAPSIRATRTLDPTYAVGVAFPVTIDVTVSGAPVRVEETVPAGWTISGISAGGVRAGQVIAWTNVTDGARLSYDVTPPSGGAPGLWGGSIAQGGFRLAIFGDGRSVLEILDEDVSPWIVRDIGNPLPGGADRLNGEGTPTSPMDVNIWGSGADIWGTADAFRFVYLEKKGDFRITAEVPALDYTNDWAKAGVMVRSSACANAMYTFMFATPNYGNDYQYRLQAGANAVQAGQTGAGALVPWVRIEKIGQVCTAYRSADGDTWTQHGQPQTFTAGDSLLVGLAVTSHNAAAIARAEFRNVVLEEISGLCPSDVKATCNGTDVVLTWANNYDYARIRVYRVDAAGASKRIASISAALETYTDKTAAALPAGTMTYKIVPVVGIAEVLSCGECQDGPAPCDGAQVCIAWPACATTSCGCICEGPPLVRFIRGDTDGDGMYMLSDGIQILERLFVNRTAFGSNCDKTADLDDNGQLGIGDAIYLFNFMFVAGSRLPMPPYPACGLDPTDDGLSCVGPVRACPR